MSSVLIDPNTGSPIPDPGINGAVFDPGSFQPPTPQAEIPTAGRRRRGGAFDPPDDFAVPHVWTFTSILASSYRAYWHDRFDEAVRHSREDAIIMRNDCHLMRLLQERKLAVSSLPWHLEVPDERDPWQVAVRDDLTARVRTIRRFHQIRASLLEAIWYGRYGVQIKWMWSGRPSALADRRRALTVQKWRPINGDKIGHKFDGTPYILIYSPAATALGDNAEVIFTTKGRGLVLSGEWRERFLIHSHEPDDMDFFDAESAEAVHGVGVRSRLFWIDWIKREWLANVATYMQRVGLGLTIWYFEAGNPNSEQQALASATKQSGRVNIVWPRNSQTGGKTGSGVERIEVPTGGAAFLVEAQKWLQELQELYVVGQTLSSKSEGSGLGGTGVADFHAATKFQIAKHDAANLDDTITGDDEEPGLISTMVKWTYPEVDFPIRYVTDVERAESKEKLEAIKTVVMLGADVRMDEARAAAGVSKPTEQDEVIQGQTPGTMGPGGMNGQGGGGMFGEDADPSSRGPVGGPKGDHGGGNGDGAIPFRRRGRPRRYAFDPSEPRDSSGRWTSSGPAAPEGDAAHDYLPAFREDKTTPAAQLVRDAEKANKELEDEESDFRLVPDQGEWSLQHVEHIEDHIGEGWQIVVNPLTGKPDVMGEDYFAELEKLSGDEEAQSYLHAFNEGPEPATAAELATANEELRSSGSKYRLRKSEEHGGLYVAVKVKRKERQQRAGEPHRYGHPDQPRDSEGRWMHTQEDLDALKGAVLQHGGKYNLAPLHKVRGHPHLKKLTREQQDILIKAGRRARLVTASMIEGRGGISDEEREGAIQEGENLLGYLSIRE